MTRHRLRQANLAGPAGLVSMEDGEAVELVHRASVGRTTDDSYAVVEFGGRGAIENRGDAHHRRAGARISGSITAG